ncbi:terpene cyclase/mutase family protein [Paenibacillus sacheonensis]|uniref:Squalene--hopene cyclase n=1 Tax=Paenibacillus sacheonensis TaxID=742054 RepID=A0A7X4YKH2_9BACL|nr:prenyltransferase/squalene oxidase repeat-containing protein [Paenibacillus sacheonensis]MBM7563455.1 sporulenol synthase [Paenibacillus sacheonensis]NBC67990.1 squalene--hopene cyclase [Paenibacillus sacheonensis]
MMFQRVQSGIDMLIGRLLHRQAADGSWRMGFIEYGTSVDAAAIIMLRSLGISRPKLVKELTDRMLAKQTADGAWRVYPDEMPGNASATAECYYALQYAGLSSEEPALKRAKDAFAELGGLKRIDSLLTKFHLALIGRYPWPRWFPLPLAILLLPSSSPIHFFHFSGYARVHMAPMLLLAHRKPNYKLPSIHPLTQPSRRGKEFDDLLRAWQEHFSLPLHDLSDHRRKGLWNLTGKLHDQAASRAERYILDRIETDGTLYSYSSSTILMLHALYANGYPNGHPVMKNALRGLESLVFADAQAAAKPTVQITTSAQWDTALISHALQNAGVPAEHPAIAGAGAYLLDRQHTALGDWKRNVRRPMAGGWGFSDVNTINPDVDDTTASLRAVRGLQGAAPRRAVDLGLQWLLGMQNSDGGWAAFERNIDNPLVRWVPLDGAEDAATDPSTPDLTGRTLEYLGRSAGLTRGVAFVRRAADWLYRHQERDGSWYGRWGVCYVYGTWAALTGLAAVGEPVDQPQIRKAVEWLLGIQQPDGGFGESGGSDHVKRYVPLAYSTLSQTAWALDALIAVHDKPLPAMERACDFLLARICRPGPAADYPTGAGLPGCLYTRYDSYSIVWPLLALANYRNKYGQY